MPTNDDIVSNFIEDAPPGQLDLVYGGTGSHTDIKLDPTDNYLDIKTLLPSQASDKYRAAFRKYNEQQAATVKLPGGSDEVIVCEYNSLGDDRYFDTATQTSFSFDHIARQASSTQSHALESPHADLIKSLIKSLSTHAAEHYPSATTGVYPHDNAIVLVIVANKYSLNNFWSGRWRAVYTFSPSIGALSGVIKLDVHYFEDGNVRLQTEKKIDDKVGESAVEVVRAVAAAERRYQEDLNKAFPMLNEDAFKNLRRQLPVTRQKVDWDKIGGYRLGQDIAGQTR